MGITNNFDLMNFPLTIGDIRDWLKVHAVKFHEQMREEFPPQEEGYKFEIDRFYITYHHLQAFLKYFTYKNKCELAIKDLIAIGFEDIDKLTQWARKHEVLGSELVSFDINYLWDEYDDRVCLEKDIYIFKAPFLNMICFCKVFEHVYWNHDLLLKTPLKESQPIMKAELLAIIKKYYLDTDHD